MGTNLNKQNEVISVKEWGINLVIMCIPLVNIIFLILCGFSQKAINETKRNWAKATLLIIVTGIIIVIIYIIITIIAVVSFKDNVQV